MTNEGTKPRRKHLLMLLKLNRKNEASQRCEDDILILQCSSSFQDGNSTVSCSPLVYTPASYFPIKFVRAGRIAHLWYLPTVLRAKWVFNRYLVIEAEKVLRTVRISLQFFFSLMSTNTLNLYSILHSYKCLLCPYSYVADILMI